jgi:GTP cyclohydrolase IB
MTSDSAFLQDVGLADLPFPMRVASRSDPAGQPTIATISMTARILAEFEASWINRFIQVLHSHRDRIGTATLKGNIVDYVERLRAKNVRIRLDYPFFVEKVAPVSGEKSLVQYRCFYTAVAAANGAAPTVSFGIQVPVVTTYPGSDSDRLGGLFGQTSVVSVETRSCDEIYPEELVELVDGHALSPLYSFLTQQDQASVVQHIHSVKKTSVELVEQVKSALAHQQRIDWYAVSCCNYGMLHSYSTVVGTEKSRWIPFSSYEDEEI